VTTTAILLVLAALGLFILEAALPSFGLFGLMAAAAYVYALILGFRESRELGIQVVALGLLLGPPAFFYGMRLMRRTKLGRAATLTPPTREEIAPAPPPGSPALGAVGVAATDLRPAGKVEFSGRRFDAAAAFGLVKQGSAVRVVRIEGSRLIVETAVEAALPENPT
jgi:membrane-bound serine protease (ClpP class)